MMSGVPIGGSLAALIGIPMIPALGWPSMFLVAAIVAASGLLVVFFLPEKPLRKKNEPLRQEAAEEISATGLAAPSPIPADAEPDLVGARVGRARA